MNTKKKIKKTVKASMKAKNNIKCPLTLGNINPAHGRILVLIVCIIFLSTFMLMTRTVNEKSITAPRAAVPAKVTKPSALANEINEMVHGYPIEEMAPYIVAQQPKTAMFMIAIAKKESAWGKRHPVLDGQDCYNYWGFRLKSEKMGSGGHTCFDSPKAAVDAIASRIDELVKEEKIDTPNKMVVWKCGYNCQNREKNDSEKKWIKDVDYYYSELLNKEI